MVFLGLLGLIVLIFSQKTDLTSSDLGRHLANGRVVWNNPDVLFKNFYSYTEPDFPFINHHWLYGVIVYEVYRLGNFTGLPILNILIILAAFSAAFIIAKNKISEAATDILGRPKVDGFYFASLLSLPVILLLSERVEVRPEIFSYLFIILTYVLLEAADKEKKHRRLWLLIPLFVLWANIHIYFFIGLALIGFKAVAIFVKSLIEKREGANLFFHNSRFLSAWRSVRIWIIMFFASVAAVLLNPNTWHGLAYPFNIFKNYGYEVAENKSVFFLEHLMVNNNFCLFKLVLTLLVLSWILYFVFCEKEYTLKSLKKRAHQFLAGHLFDFFISIFIAGFALFSSRNISLFGLVSLILICGNMGPVLVRLRAHNAAQLNFWQRYITPLFSRVHSYVLIFLLIFIAATFLFLINDARSENKLIKNSFGWGLYKNNEDSIGFFNRNKLSGPIFNNYDIGGALIFWLGGREKVFVDNRPEAYSNAFFNDIYKPMQTDPAKWEEYFKKYDFKTIYFTHTDGTPWAQQFLKRILQDKKWRLVYFDATTIILINSEKYSAAEVQTLSLDVWKIKAGLRELSVGANLKTRLHLASLADLIGIKELAEELYRGVLSAYPENYQALFSLSGLYAGYNDRDNLLKSISYSQRALDAGLDLPAVYNQMGLVYWQLGLYQEAAQAWHSALKRERNNAHALYYLKQVEELKKAGELPASFK